jgi:hypothetical protein
LVDQALELFVKHANAKDSLTRAIINRKIAMVMRGWVGINDPGINQLKYNHQRRDLFHLWSAKSFGHTFGMREYSKLMSIKEYMEMPIDIIDDLLEGYGRGTEELAKSRAAAAKKAADEAKRGSLSESELAAMAAAQRGDK